MFGWLTKLLPSKAADLPPVEIVVSVSIGELTVNCTSDACEIVEEVDDGDDDEPWKRN